MSPADTFRLERFLPYLVHSIGSSFAEGFAERFAAAGVSRAEWRILAVLYEFGDRPIGELARRTSINASTMTRLIGQMEARGLVRRHRPPGNQRTVVVRLLKLGTAIAETLIPQVVAYEAELAACFTPQELETLKALLARLYENISVEEQATAPAEAIAG